MHAKPRLILNGACQRPKTASVQDQTRQVGVSVAPVKSQRKSVRLRRSYAELLDTILRVRAKANEFRQ